ncbi:S8 family serine peptidase [Ectobacillus sp. JY-23]|uniref:S8 family serine peptidase n=1 Tax=Ectobacillus sp. JY-23 TaxID=2933872 RepID=UPI001FF0F993|nr:S8 family serine peptidase [Ectobacillus sp. JY-23]UOY94213.1 S8 family serine peptidase [Ectobacillus sp. JY-23]
MGVNKMAKKTAMLALSTGLLLSPLSTNPFTAVKATTWKAEDILLSLTLEQRQALHQLQLNNQQGLQGFQEGELQTEEEVSVIVEFRSKPSHVAVLEAKAKGKSLTKAAAQAQIDKEHKVFKEDLEKYVGTKGKQKVPVITQAYKTAYNGVAITLPANQVQELLQSEAVKAVYKNVVYMVEPVQQELPSDVEREITTSVESLPYLQVDKLHKEGITGKGIKVGVLDTGVDYNHPDLKDAYKGGYDFVDDDSDPMEATYKDWQASQKPEFNNGSSYYTSHGTHVSGTIVGQNENNSEVSVEGVAPDADLYAYRVLGPYGSGSSEDIIAGIEKAVVDGMDVINLSLGAAVNHPYYPTSTALNYAVLNGVTAVVSAGNSGPNNFTLGSPGTAALALTVGASDVPISQFTFTGQVGGWKTDIVSMARSFSDTFAELEGVSLELVDVGLGNIVDYKNKNVKGKIAFVQRGGFALNDKVKFAKDNGAKAVILYNSVEGHVGYNLGESTTFIPAFSMTKQAGEELKAKIASGNTTFTFTNAKETLTQGDKLADFSSRGPVNGNFEMKPEIVAPGVSVLSTLPSYMTNPAAQEDYKYAYGRLNGTSMASPFAAGVAALLLEKNPELAPTDVKTILMNSADKLNGDYSVFEVGAGRIDPYQALHTQVKVQVQDETLIPNGDNLVTIENQTGGLSFDKQVIPDGSHTKVKKTLEITNNSDKKKSFHVEMVENVQKGTNSLKENGITVELDNLIKVAQNSVKQVHASLTIPSKAKKGFYEGYFLITNSEDKTESYRVPFSFKKSQEGFDTFELLSRALTPSYYNHAFDGFRTTSVMSGFNLGSSVETLDIVLQDGKTNEDLGLVGTIDMKSAQTDTDYFLPTFNGAYYKFTGNKKQPVSADMSIAEPGHYKLKFITTLPNGKQKIQVEDVFIDIETPQVKSSLDSDSPFLEYKPGQATYPFEVEVTDSNVAEMQKVGIAIDKSSNFAVYTYGLPVPNGPIYMDKDGKWVDEVAMNPNAKSLSFNVIGYDVAGNQANWKEYFFVKEGTPVTYAKHNVEQARSGDILSAALVLDNLQGVKEATWSFPNGIQHVSLVSADLADKFKGKASIQVNGNQIKVTFNEATVFDRAEIVNVKVKVQDQLFYPIGYINPTATIVDANGQTVSLLNGGKRFLLKPKFNRLQGSLIPEGFLVEGENYQGRRDWSKVGATFKVTNGQYSLDASNIMDGSGRFNIEPLPLNENPYTFEVTVPGHFSTKKKQKVGFEYKGEMYGKSDSINISLVAGDVNQDNVIDVKDAIAVQEAWNTNNRAADINFDGIANAKDIKFVQKNYLKQNPTALDAPAPITELNGKTLESILKELGL